MEKIGQTQKEFVFMFMSCSAGRHVVVGRLLVVGGAWWWEKLGGGKALGSGRSLVTSGALVVRGRFPARPFSHTIWTSVLVVRCVF